MKWLLADGVFYNLRNIETMWAKISGGSIILELDNRHKVHTILLLTTARAEKRNVNLHSMIKSLNDNIMYLLQDKDRGFLNANDMVDYELDNGENLNT